MQEKTGAENPYSPGSIRGNAWGLGFNAGREFSVRERNRISRQFDADMARRGLRAGFLPLGNMNVISVPLEPIKPRRRWWQFWRVAE